MTIGKRLNTNLGELGFDFQTYRASYDRVYSRRLTRPRHCAQYFFRMLKATSRLYGDYLVLREIEESIPTRPDAETRPSQATLLAKRERRIRDRFRKRVEALPAWSHFSPRNPFTSENQLQSRADYTERLVLHLPEIYAETIRLEGCVKEGEHKGVLSDSCLADLIVGLEHIAHHASYCRHALEILSYEGSWTSWKPKSLRGAKS